MFRDRNDGIPEEAPCSTVTHDTVIDPRGTRVIVFKYLTNRREQDTNQRLEKTSIIPFNSLPGCIVRCDPSFFPIFLANSGTAHIEPKTCESLITNVVASCTFSDASFITVEGPRRSLSEHAIFPTKNQNKLGPSRPICNLNSKPKTFKISKSTPLKVHATRHGSKVVVLCCRESGKLEYVQFEERGGGT